MSLTGRARIRARRGRARDSPRASVRRCHHPRGRPPSGCARGPHWHRRRRSTRPLPMPEQDGRATPGDDDLVGLVGRDDGEAVRPLDVRQRGDRRGPRGWSPDDSSIRWASASVSVSVTNWWPEHSSRLRRTSAFSMIPLCTTAICPVQSTCGCALRSLGAPWVAQRVCAIPQEPVTGSRPRASSAADRAPRACAARCPTHSGPRHRPSRSRGIPVSPGHPTESASPPSDRDTPQFHTSETPFSAFEQWLRVRVNPNCANRWATDA